MKFEEIIIELKNGRKVRRQGWASDVKAELTDAGIEVTNTTCYKVILSKEDIMSDDWELSGLSQFIKHKYLCKFWNTGFEADAVISTLRNYGKDPAYPFEDAIGCYWENCHPLKEDEVKIYPGD